MKELSVPAPRSLLHTRTIQCRSWQREDGLWDIEGRLLDTRTYDLANWGGSAARKAGEPIHFMSLRITLDDTYKIVDAEACSHQAPYEDCPRINEAYAALIGMRIQPGFIRAVKNTFAGAAGCTHLTELLGPIATTALQSLPTALARRRAAAGEPPINTSGGPGVNSCYALRQGAPAAIVRWGPRGDTAGPGNAADEDSRHQLP